MCLTGLCLGWQYVKTAQIPQLQQDQEIVTTKTGDAIQAQTDQIIEEVQPGTPQPPAQQTNIQPVEQPTVQPAPAHVAAPEKPSKPITRVLAPGDKNQVASKKGSVPRDGTLLADLKKHEKGAKTLQVPPPTTDDDELVEFQFENTDLKNVIDQAGILFNTTFIPDDIVNPLPQGSTATTGNKITFRTHNPMNKKQAWNLFLSFLDIAGFALVPEKSPNRYRVVTSQKAGRLPEPVYIGVDPEKLPDNDQTIRYVYFVENGNMTVIMSIVDKLRSVTSEPPVVLTDAKAFILVDKSYNIKTLMVIVKELDKVSIPQSLSIIKLQRADAKDVKALFEQLMGEGTAQQGPMFMPPRQQPTALFFPPTTRLIAEPRTNTLIVLGTPEAIEKIENFVRKNIDKDIDIPHSPLFYYDLKFADANTVKKILDETVATFGQGTAAGQVGGIRGVDQYVKPMVFIADPATNRIIIRGDYQSYLMVKELIAKLDQPQPQVAIEVLVLSISLSKAKKLGAQIRNKIQECGNFVTDKVQFQTSGLNGTGVIQERATASGEYTIANRLMGNLLNLVSSLEAGNTIISLGRDLYGVWGLIQVLETYSAAEVVSNPFIIASNKQKAKVEVGEVRRVVTSTIIQNGDQQTPSYDDDKATLMVEILPQINSDGMITLDIHVNLTQFRDGSTAQNVAKLTRDIVTKSIVSDREVLALGGLIQNRNQENLGKVPVLADVPVLGWLFKNRSNEESRDNLLVLISTHIIDPLSQSSAAGYTQRHIDDYYGTLSDMQDVAENRDPIYRMFFKPDPKSVGKRIEDFIFQKPSKRTKKLESQLEEMKKLHPAIGDQPELLEAITPNQIIQKTEDKELALHVENVPTHPQVATTAGQKRRHNKVSLTNEATA
jgi:general secretion pathway protein D